MTESKMVELIKNNFGYPKVEVYTPDSSIQNFIKEGFDLLVGKVLKEEEFALPCKTYQKINKEEVPLIIDIVPYKASSGSFGAYYKDEFSLATAVEYFNVYGNGLATPILANIAYNQLNYAFNNCFDWKYMRHTGELYATNIPEGTSFLAVKAKVYYTMETLSTDLDNWLYRYALAKAKMVEGSIRRKYKEGSVGAPSDGDQLVSEGKEEFAPLADELQNFISLDIGRRR